MDDKDRKIAELEKQVKALQAQFYDAAEAEQEEAEAERRREERRSRPEWPKKILGIWRDAAGNAVPPPVDQDPYAHMRDLDDVRDAVPVESERSREVRLGAQFDELVTGLYSDDERDLREAHRQAYIDSGGNRSVLPRQRDFSGVARDRHGKRLGVEA